MVASGFRLRPRHDYAPNAATNGRAGGLDVLQRVPTKADTMKDLLLGPRSCPFRPVLELLLCYPSIANTSVSNATAMPNESITSTPPSTAPRSPTSPTSISGLVDCEKGNNLNNFGEKGEESNQNSDHESQCSPKWANSSRTLLNLDISTPKRHKPCIEDLELLSKLHIDENLATYSVKASTHRRKTQIGPAK